MLKWMPCSGPMPAMTESKWPAATPLAQPSLRLEASTDQCQCAPQQGRPLRPLISSQHNLPGAHLGRLTQITQMPACSSRSVIAGSTSSPQRDSAWTMHRSEQKTKQSERCFAEHLSTIAFALCCESDRALNKTSAGPERQYSMRIIFWGVHLLGHAVFVKSMPQPSDVMKRTVLMPHARNTLLERCF